MLAVQNQTQTQTRTEITEQVFDQGAIAGVHLASSGSPSAQTLQQILNMPFISDARELIGVALFSAGETLNNVQSIFGGISELGMGLQGLSGMVIGYDAAVKGGVMPRQEINADFLILDGEPKMTKNSQFEHEQSEVRPLPSKDKSDMLAAHEAIYEL